jgi:SSS family solute:Na+ symporter
MLWTVGITTVVWLVCTFATSPEPQETLLAFYRRARPSAALWQPIAKLAPEVPPARDLAYNFLDWICGCVLIYGMLFGVGKLLLGETALGVIFVIAGLAAAGVIYWDLSRRGWETVLE